MSDPARPDGTGAPCSSPGTQPPLRGVQSRSSLKQLSLGLVSVSASPPPPGTLSEELPSLALRSPLFKQSPPPHRYGEQQPPREAQSTRTDSEAQQNIHDTKTLSILPPPPSFHHPLMETISTSSKDGAPFITAPKGESQDNKHQRGKRKSRAARTTRVPQRETSAVLGGKLKTCENPIWKKWGLWPAGLWKPPRF